MTFDPCVRCGFCNTTSRARLWRGTPINLGRCTRSKSHWDYIEAHEYHEFVRASIDHRLHIEARHSNRHKGWRT